MDKTFLLSPFLRFSFNHSFLSFFFSFSLFFLSPHLSFTAMAAFTSLVSKFKHDSDGRDNQASQDNDRKRMLSSDLAAADDSEEGSTSSSLAFRTRKSLRLSTPHPNARPSSSRVIGADSIKSRPHYKREPVVETTKKEEVKEEIKEEKKPV